MSRFEDIDWKAVDKKLRAFAEWRCGGAAATFDCGLSGEDVVNEVWAAFFGSPNALGWNKEKGSLENFLFKAVQNKVIDHVRRTGKVAGSLDDAAIAAKIRHKDANPVATLAHEQFVNRMYELVGDDQELRDLIAATELIEGGHNVNQQLAECMGKSPQEIVNLKRRLLNVEGIRELYEQRRKRIRSGR